MGEFNTQRPFRAAEHGVAGPRRATFQRIREGVYLDRSVGVTARIKAEAAWLYCRGGAVLGGRSAAAALGMKYLDERRREGSGWQHFDPEPAVLIRPRSGSGRSCAGLTTHRIDLPEHEIVSARDMRLTSAARTGFDLGRWPATAARGWRPDSRADLDRRAVPPVGPGHADSGPS